MWQSLREYRAGIPERLARWKQAELASQEPFAQVEQHEPSSHDKAYANDDHRHMTYWLSHGRLRIVLVITQRYVDGLSNSSSGTSILTTVLVGPKAVVEYCI